jgi:hypothetical protein
VLAVPVLAIIKILCEPAAPVQGVRAYARRIACQGARGSCRKLAAAETVCGTKGRGKQERSKLQNTAAMHVKETVLTGVC